MTDSAQLVLIVEDDLANNELMSEILSIHGYRIEATQDGQDALDLFETIKPYLVIMDLGIPTVDGLEVCRRMRIRSDVPILMVTGRADEETLKLIQKAGANGYLPKPFDINQFIFRVKTLMDAAPVHL